jgi:hypothetical protein
MRESLKQFFVGPVGDLVIWLGVLGTLVWLARVTSEGDPWMWLAFGLLALSALSFWRFHKMRQELVGLRARMPTQPIQVHPGGHLTINNNYAQPEEGNAE